MTAIVVGYIEELFQDATAVCEGVGPLPGAWQCKGCRQVFVGPEAVPPHKCPGVTLALSEQEKIQAVGLKASRRPRSPIATGSLKGRR